MQVAWQDQLAAFSQFLGDILQHNRDKPDSRQLVTAAAVVTTEIQSGAALNEKESRSLQRSYLKIMQNVLAYLQVRFG